MNRPLLITIGIVIILLVLGVWVYLMLFGTPDNTDEIFTNLGFNIASQVTTVTPPPIDTQPLENLVDTQSSDKLRQLTMRSVAGFTFAVNSNNEQTIRYIERGTGHMYEINLATGVEEIISRTTFPKTATAVFSHDADTVSLTSHQGYITNVFVGTLTRDQSLTGIQLEPNAKNIAFADTGEILYTVSQENTTIGYKHNLSTETRVEKFSFNFINLDVGWGGDLDDVYLATKPAHNLEGFIYTTNNNILTPAMPSFYGLSAFYSNEYIIATYVHNQTSISVAIDDDGQITTLPIIALKEKCVFDAYSNHYLWCAAPIEFVDDKFVENWYKGTETSEDFLWLVDIQDGSAKLYADMKEISGRTIDIKEIQINNVGDTISFINKLDQTLWLVDLIQ